MHKSHTIFDDIVEGNMKAWKVWEDEKFLAFLTPFPNTLGFTVVIPKENSGDYILTMGSKMDDARLDEIQAKIVAAGR